MTKILHVWDQASVACTLAKYQRKEGHEVRVIKRAGFDRFGIMDFYGEKTFKTFFGRGFLKIALKEARNYDIIHIHDLFKVVPQIRKKYPDKKIMLHYHGSILRNNPSNIRFEAESCSNQVLVSTPDLTKFVNAIYIQNPVDTEHFTPREINKNNKALSIMTKLENKETLKKLLKENGISLNLEAISREKKGIMYPELPTFLSNYEYLVDLKLIYDDKPMLAYGMLGLQALSVGLKVINYEYKITQGLPKEHKPERVTKRLLKIYDE